MSEADGPVARRLRWYWQLEAANAVILPAIAGVLIVQAGEQPTPATIFAALACSWLLLIGAAYWRASLRKMEGAVEVFDHWLPRLAAAEGVSVLLVLAAIVVTALDCSSGGGWTASRIAAVSLTVLALLEYINYYKVQLQHFDNWADFKRLITGRGFRKAHMARAIARWRASRATERRKS